MSSQCSRQQGCTHLADPGNHRLEVEVKAEVEGGFQVAVVVVDTEPEVAENEQGTGWEQDGEVEGMNISGVGGGHLMPLHADEDVNADEAGEAAVGRRQVRVAEDARVLGTGKADAASKGLEC